MHGSELTDGAHVIGCLPIHSRRSMPSLELHLSCRLRLREPDTLEAATTTITSQPIPLSSLQLAPSSLRWQRSITPPAKMAKPFNTAFAITKVPAPLTPSSQPYTTANVPLQKYTQGSTGIWETIRRALAVDPNRSNGIPIKHFRNPTPGALDPNDYDDPVTLPAGDIADNPYWKRDTRRAYPNSSYVTQGDAVSLLTMGSAASPSPKLLAGEEGAKQLVAAKEEGHKGLAVLLESEKALGAQVLGEGGMPPMPVQSRASGTIGAEKYEVAPVQAYNDQYPCRSFV